MSDRRRAEPITFHSTWTTWTTWTKKKEERSFKLLHGPGAVQVVRLVQVVQVVRVLSQHPLHGVELCAIYLLSGLLLGGQSGSR